jgi:ribose transport system ATP-binding protein
VLSRPVLENAIYSSVVKFSRFSLVPWKKLKKKTKASIDSLSTRYPHPEVEIRFLSGGNQQKVVFAKLLGAECDILILDEPTRGVDVGARTEIYKDMQRLKKEGKAILMISSDLSELLSQSDRILVMSKGTIVGNLARDEATEEKVLSLALNVSEVVA